MAKEKEPPTEQDPTPDKYEPEEESRDEGKDDDEDRVKVKAEEDGGVTVELPKTRKARRAERAVTHKYTEEAKRNREENERLNRHIAELTNLLSRQQQAQAYQPPAQSQADPYQQELDHIRAEQETIQQALRSGAVDNTQVERYRQRFYALDSRAREMDRARIKEELRHELQRQTGAREGEHEEAVLKAEFPDVVQHPQAMQYARGEYYRLLAKGRPPSLATSREALTTAAEEFGLRQRQMPQVAAGIQQRYGAVPQQAGQRSVPGKVTLDKIQQKIAISRWPEDDEKVAYAKMAELLARAQPEEERGE